MMARELSDGKWGIVRGNPSGHAHNEFSPALAGCVPRGSGAAQVGLGTKPNNPPEDTVAKRCCRFF
jgi:hypothetical protein